MERHKILEIDGSNTNLNNTKFFKRFDKRGRVKRIYFESYFTNPTSANFTLEFRLVSDGVLHTMTRSFGVSSISSGDLDSNKGYYLYQDRVIHANLAGGLITEVFTVKEVGDILYFLVDPTPIPANLAYAVLWIEIVEVAETTVFIE